MSKKFLVVIPLVFLLLCSCAYISDMNSSNQNSISSSALQESNSIIEKTKQNSEVYEENSIDSSNENSVQMQRYCDTKDIQHLIDLCYRYDFNDEEFMRMRIDIISNAANLKAKAKDSVQIRETDIDINAEYNALNDDIFYTCPINNEISLGEMIVENEIDALSNMCYITDFESQHGTGSSPVQEDDSHLNAFSEIPITSLRMVDIETGKYYAVQKLENGGYIYIFFDQRYNVLKDEYYSDPRLFKAIGCVYMENVLTKEDFDLISIGDNIDKVAQIDSSVKVYEYANAYRESEGFGKLEDYTSKNKFSSRHLFEDGLLTIFYERADQYSEYYVSDIVFSSDFIFESPYLQERYEGAASYPKQFKILPQDYPPAS